MSSAQVHWLADGRLHLHHGPIDLICQAEGPGRQQALAAAIARFDGLLQELVAELPALRAQDAPLHGPIARRMGQAVAPFRPAFITPMAAVAGAVAEAVLAAMGQDLHQTDLHRADLHRAYVNNGGDIALHLAPGQSLVCALAQGGQVTLRAQDRARGVATSGWRGRSWSFGIADAVTVLAAGAAEADAAATMIANAVDLPGDPAISRRPAQDLQADSDLGARLVTVGVGRLSATQVEAALDRGLALAEALLRRGLIEGASLFLQGEVRSTGQGALARKESAHV